MHVHVHVHVRKQSKANGGTQGRQLISKKKAELPCPVRVHVATRDSLFFSASWYQPYHWTDRAFLPTLTGGLLLRYTLPLLQDGPDRRQLLPLQGGASAGRGSLPEGPAPLPEGYVQDDAGSSREGTRPESSTGGEACPVLCAHVYISFVVIIVVVVVVVWESKSGHIRPFAPPYSARRLHTLQVPFHLQLSHSSLPIL